MNWNWVKIRSIDVPASWWPRAVVTDGVDLPEDAVIEILAWLPVKSLLRFKCVCKSWYSLVKSPSFINKHLNYASSCSNRDNARILLKDWNTVTKEADVSFLLNEATAEFSQHMAMPFFDVDDMHLCYSILFYGPCNGIICVFGKTSDSSYRLGDLIALWNPATREIKRLLYSNVSCRENTKVTYVEIGFGFDSKTNDYKVVRILGMRDKQTRKLVDPVIEVYNLSADSWRVIDIILPKTMRWRTPEYSTYLNGFYYWWADDAGGKFVLSFDFANEVFGKIPSPDIKNYKPVNLVKFNESIAIFADETEDLQNPDLHCVVVYVLNMDDHRKTWTKLFKIPFLCHLAGILRSSEAILIKSGNNGCQLVSYDPITQEIKNLLEWDYRYWHTFQLVNYVESLVSFNEDHTLYLFEGGIKSSLYLFEESIKSSLCLFEEFINKIRKWGIFIFCTMCYLFILQCIRGSSFFPY